MVILDGIRVLDFTQYLAGPTVTRLMVEMGSEGIKVELAPGGDLSRGLPIGDNGRSGYFIQQNRGKQSLCLDLRQREADAILRALVAKLVVVVENCGPRVMAKRHLTYANLNAIKPDMSPVEALHRPHFKARGTLRHIKDPVMGPLTIAGFPLRFSAQPTLPELVAPVLGQHNAQGLEGLPGDSAAQVAQRAARGVLKSGPR